MNVTLNERAELPIARLQAHLPSLMIKYHTLTLSFPLLIPLRLLLSFLPNALVTLPDERRNWKWYPAFSLDGWVLLWLFSWTGKTQLWAAVMAFSDFWQGGSSCFIVLVARWGGGGNAISDWSVRRRFDVCRPLGIFFSVWVCKGKRKEREGILCVNFARLQSIEQARLCAV